MEAMIIFEIRDSKAVAFLRPFFSQNEDTARRAVMALLVDGNSPLKDFPADYALFRCGVWDPHEGLISAEVPTIVCQVVTLSDQVRQQTQSLQVVELAEEAEGK